MALWEGFLECWKDFVSRTGSQVIDYLKTHEEHIKPGTTKHILSIGPGTGEIDHALVSLLPQLSSYTVVEPDSGALDILKGRMEEFSGIEKHYVNDRMQTYTGPRYGADLILMSHVAYYFADSFPQQINHAISWLNKDGGRILLVHNSSPYIKVLRSVSDLRRETCDHTLVDDIRHQLETMGVNFTESPIEYPIDVSNPGPTYYGFLSVMMNRRATKKETEKALGIIRQFLIPGTQKVHGSQVLFTIKNTPNTQN